MSRKPSAVGKHPRLRNGRSNVDPLVAIRYLAGTCVSGTVELFISIIPGRRWESGNLDSQSTSKVASFCKERMLLCLHRDQRE